MAESQEPTELILNRGELAMRRGSAVHKMWTCYDPEILLEGPAGVGKTRCLLELIHYRAETYPGSRYLLARKARSSMSQSVLVTLERDVIPNAHESVLRRVTRTHRHSYQYANGSELVIGGLDDIQKTFSSEYDMICIFEAIECSESDWEFLHRCLRNNMIPHPEKPGSYLAQAIADTNPGAEGHWLNRRAASGRMTRLKAKFADNPTITPEYLDILRNMTGIRRDRLYLGRWVSAEGQIWENFDSDRHVIAGLLTKHDVTQRWLLKIESWERTVEMEWFFAGVDHGFKAPGTIHVYGVDAQRNAYLVHETYMCGMNTDWWGAEAERLRKIFDIKRFICDPAEPKTIDLFNKRMGQAGGFWIAVAAENEFLMGSNIVRERLEKDQLFFLANALYTGGKRHGTLTGNDSNDNPIFLNDGDDPGPDPLRIEKRKPTCTTEEIPGYSYRVIKEGQAIKEEPAIDSEDHGCDTCRYAMVFLDNTDWSPPAATKSYEAGTYGHMLGHENVANEVEELMYASGRID